MEKYGFIDKNRQEVTHLKYDYADVFTKNFAKVELNDKYGFVNDKGEEITPIKYDNITSLTSTERKEIYISYALRPVGEEVENLPSPEALLAMVELNGEELFIDTTGREISKNRYSMHILERIICYHSRTSDEGIFYIPHPNYELTSGVLNGKCGFVDGNGKVVIPIKYDDVGYFSEGVAWVKADGKWGIIKKPLPSPLSPPTTYAVLVGVQNYKFSALNDKDSVTGPGDLISTDIAAIKFQSLLTSSLRLPLKNTKDLVNASASKKQILKAISEKAEQAGTEDVLVFYFAGHGKEEGMYVYDSDMTPFTLLHYEELLDIMERSSAKHKIIIVDACVRFNLYGRPR